MKRLPVTRTAPGDGQPGNETDDELDYPDGFHWTAGAYHGYPPGGAK